MKDYRRIIEQRITEDDYPREAKEEILAAYDRLASVPRAFRLFSNVVWMYDEGVEFSIKNTVHRGREACALAGVDPRMGLLLIFLAMSDTMHKRYREKGFSEDMFKGAVLDYKWKLLECKAWDGVWGILPFEWFDRFLDGTRPVLGRLQYEIVYSPMAYKSGEYSIEKSDPVVNMHIPSSGPLTPDSVMESFREAERFYAPLFGGGAVPFMCSSWLLAPFHGRILPETSNIRRFGEMFDVVKVNPDEEGGCLVRIFNQRYQGDPSVLREDTSLQRAYKQYLMRGEKACSAVGFFFMKDGKLIKG